jgi:hypothetical protein
MVISIPNGSPYASLGVEFIAENGGGPCEAEERVRLQISIIRPGGQTANRPRHEQKLRAGACRT